MGSEMCIRDRVQVVRQLRELAPADLAIAGCAYSYLQDFLPHVTQRLVSEVWIYVVGLGVMVLSLPGLGGAAMASGAPSVPTSSACLPASRSARAGATRT